MLSDASAARWPPPDAKLTPASRLALLSIQSHEPNKLLFFINTSGIVTENRFIQKLNLAASSQEVKESWRDRKKEKKKKNQTKHLKLFQEDSENVLFFLHAQEIPGVGRHHVYRCPPGRTGL